jgi:DNA polymerase-3 subunit alpha
VISDIPLENYVPLFKAGDGQITTGYAMHALEKIGLLKMDFLGLRTLTVISEALKIIKETKGITIEIEKIPMDDQKTFELLSEAKTFGVFQLESVGMRDLLKKLEPSRFEDLIALLALYRPGPIGSGMLDDFIKRKKGAHAINYDHPKLEPILKDTYGIIVFQEQVMQIASELAGFSLTQADHLRRAMSKKIPEVMERLRKEFSAGCTKNGISKSLSTKIFDLVEYFSGYGFNRSHSAAYALISYRTAYLKANFPVEFMCALLTSEKDNTDKIVEYVGELGRMNIELLPPDVHESFDQFKVIDNDKIRFGLLAVKNVGQGAINSIIETRKSGKFKSLYDFCERIDSRLVNRKVIESLIKCGAFDCLGLFRSQLMAMLDNVIAYGSKMQKEKATGQLSFFDMKTNGFERRFEKPPQIKEWPQTQILSFEKEMLGFYITGHPLARYETQLKKFGTFSTADLAKLTDGQEVSVAGIISKLKHTTTRRTAERMAIFLLEDFHGAVEVLVFPKTFQVVSKYIKPNMIVLVKGRLNLREQSPKVIADDIRYIDDAYKSIQSINIELSGVQESTLRVLKEKLSNYPGKTPVYLNLNTNSSKTFQIIVGEEFYVQPSETLFQELEGLLGEKKFSLTL